MANRQAPGAPAAAGAPNPAQQAAPPPPPPNNNGAPAGAAPNAERAAEHIEFTVKAEEDLFLEGGERTIPRVRSQTNYSCVMLKGQRFHSLFRHYAKYHGLKKDELEYAFVNFLENDDTPESVQLQRGDVILVKKKRAAAIIEPAEDDEEFRKDMVTLMEDEEHMDAVFCIDQSDESDTDDDNAFNPMSFTASSVSSSALTKSKSSSSSSPSKPDQDQDQLKRKRPPIEVKAHKSVLAARGEYFKGIFRKGCWAESDQGIIRVDSCFSVVTVKRLIEFLYTNRIEKLKELTAQEILDLIHLSDQWLLRDLKRCCEYRAMKLVCVSNVGKMLCATELFDAKRLQRACTKFVMDNLKEVTEGKNGFVEEIKEYPQLLLPILSAAAAVMPEVSANKKQRTAEATVPAGDN